MAYNPYPYPGGYPIAGYQPGLYTPAVPDQLAQLRQNQQLQATQPAIQPQMAIPQQIQPQAESGGIIWVQGEAGAKAYLVAPGSTVQLWDSEDQVIYLKSADMSGMPSMRVLDYTERGGRPVQKQEQPPPIDFDQFITRDELENILAERLKRPTKTTKPKEDTGNGERLV